MEFGRVLRWLAAGLAPLLSACENGPSVVSNFSKGQALIDSVLTYASKDGPILAQVLGNPFGMEEPLFGNLVRDRLPDGVMGRVVTFTGRESEAPHPNIRVIVMFGGLTAMPAHRLCDGRHPELSFNPDKLTVRAVLCADGDPLSDAEGWARNIQGPNDRPFRRLLGDMSRALLQGRG
ncbi:MAG: hypothetical protein H7841_11790 [Magnetospirillum sp. WYHS-4]